MFYSRLGISLTEVLVTAVVIAVLASLAIPMLRTAVESSRRSEAIGHLRIIHMAQRDLRRDTGNYFGPENILANINANLSISLTERDYDVDITARTAGTSFTARANTNGTGDKWFEIDETGTITEGGSY